MGHRTSTEGHKVLVTAPYGRDAESVVRMLCQHGYDAHACADLDAVSAVIDEHVGVIMLTEEALRFNSDRLREVIAAQPAWSDIPFVLLAAQRRSGRNREDTLRARIAEFTGNAVILERPLGLASLLSTATSAMRARQKQFEMRDRIGELAESESRLEQKVSERTAELEAEMASRGRAEAALRQSQKMEAVGQLTGGIAHDFNNMLTGVIGALDILKRRIADGRTDDLDRFMDAASVSAQRAAALTARLLAFSRRQSLDLKPIDVSALVQSLEDLLRRTIRENIALRIVTDSEVTRAVGDANQLENAILNLAINARDAMPDGGELSIETRLVELDDAYVAASPDIHSGRYVVIAVTDTGVGMAPEVVEKVFDPFFTTKPIGQGTGLGLSMVHGFAHQSGGQVRVHSQPGVGTTVSVYLKASAPSEDDTEQATVQPIVEGDGQTVLLVEDDPSVRLLVREVLEELSYTPLEASEANEAIPILASDRQIDLMVSDVGLPGMNGRQLAEIARQHRPELPILFVTGYAENAAIRADFLGTNMAMITKPFAIDALAKKISGMIGSQ